MCSCTHCLQAVAFVPSSHQCTVRYGQYIACTHLHQQTMLDDNLHRRCQRTWSSPLCRRLRWFSLLCPAPADAFLAGWKTPSKMCWWMRLRRHLKLPCCSRSCWAAKGLHTIPCCCCFACSHLHNQSTTCYLRSNIAVFVTCSAEALMPTRTHVVHGQAVTRQVLCASHLQSSTSVLLHVVKSTQCLASMHSTHCILRQTYAFHAGCRVVLVGDPQQLPATVLSRQAQLANMERSMFERCPL